MKTKELNSWLFEASIDIVCLIPLYFALKFSVTHLYASPVSATIVAILMSSCICVISKGITYHVYGKRGK